MCFCEERFFTSSKPQTTNNRLANPYLAFTILIKDVPFVSVVKVHFLHSNKHQITSKRLLNPDLTFTVLIKDVPFVVLEKQFFCIRTNV
jgi:hypothetical protein